MSQPVNSSSQNETQSESSETNVTITYENDQIIRPKVDDNGWTDLHIAAIDGDDKKLQRNIVQWKNYVNQQDIYGSTALHFAARWGHTRCLDLLLSQGQADVNILNNIGWSPLHCATWEGELTNVKRLIQTENNTVNSQSQNGWTPLHLAARWGYNEITVELLTTANARRDVKDNDGETPSHQAAIMGRTGILKLFNEKRILNLYEKTSYDKTIIDFAFTNKKTLDFCINMDDKYGMSFLQHVAIQDHKNLFKYLLKKPQRYKGIFPKDDFNSLYTIKGRDDELKQLKQIFQTNKIVVVTGISGIGKTAFVKSYAWSNQEYYSNNLFFVDCQNEESFKISFFKIARFLKIPTKKYENERDFTAIIKDVFSRFKQETGLLVFDNATDVLEVNKYFTENLKIDIIVITCQKDLVNMKCFDLGPISLESAVEIFEPLFEDLLLKETDRESVRTLTSILKGVPLAIRIAQMHLIHNLFSFPATESNFILSSYIDKITTEISSPITRFTDLIKCQYENIIYAVVNFNFNELHHIFSILLISCSFLNPSLISIRCVLKMLQFIEAIHSAQRYVRSLIWVVNNNKVHFNNYAKSLILYRVKTENSTWMARGYKYVIELILNVDYPHHHKSVFSFAGDYSEVIQEFGKTKLLRYLATHGCVNNLTTIFSELSQEEKEKYVKKYSLLFAAVKSGDLPTVKLVYEYDKNLKRLNEMGHTMIWEAIEKNYTEVCDFLISKGASLDHIDKLNKTPLHRAAFLGKIDIVKLLLKRGMDPNIRNKFLRTPLHYAAMEGHNDVIMELLEHKDIKINARDHYRRSPVFETVRCFQLDTLRLFIQRGAKIRTKDNLDLSPVRLAKLQKNKKELLQVFKEHGFYEEIENTNTCLFFKKNGIV